MRVTEAARFEEPVSWGCPLSLLLFLRTCSLRDVILRWTFVRMGGRVFFSCVDDFELLYRHLTEPERADPDNWAIEVASDISSCRCRLRLVPFYD